MHLWVDQTMRAIIIIELIAEDMLDQGDHFFHDEKLGQKMGIREVRCQA